MTSAYRGDETDDVLFEIGGIRLYPHLAHVSGDLERVEIIVFLQSSRSLWAFLGDEIDGATYPGESSTICVLQFYREAKVPLVKTRIVRIAVEIKQSRPAYRLQGCRQSPIASLL